MYYVLSESEFKQGCEIVQMWEEYITGSEKLLNLTDNLHRQGYFTITECMDVKNHQYRIKVFAKEKDMS